MTKFIKIITLSDIHYPDNIDLTQIYKFLKDEQPDQVGFIGDITNADGISRFWERDEEEGVYNAVEELEGFRDNILHEIQKSTPKSKIWLVGGNHLVERARKSLVKKPYRMKLLDINKYLDGVRIFDYGKYYTIGELNYTHGNYFVDAHAKKHVLNIMKNLVYGHTHSVQEYTKHSPVDEKPIMAKSIGCLCKTNPHYRNNIPNHWVNAFHIAYINKNDGSFYDYTIKVDSDGSFFFNNKHYKA